LKVGFFTDDYKSEIAALLIIDGRVVKALRPGNQPT
jgi:hypothetical protein